MPNLTERLRACYTGAVHDVLRTMGHERIVLPPAIKPLDRSQFRPPARDDGRQASLF